MAVIADSDSVLAFRAIGFDTYLVSPDNAAEELEKQCESGKYAVIFLSENLAEKLEDELAKYDKIPLPAICIIPIDIGKKDVGFSRLQKLSIKATGTDVVSKLRGR